MGDQELISLLLAAAQAASVVPAPAQCAIVTAQEKGGDQLIGVCNGQGVLLGPFDSYESAVHDASGAAVAVITRRGGQRVVLIRASAEGEPVREELTADLARQNGRAADAGLDGLTVDLSQFATEAVVTTRVAGVSARGAVLPEKPFAMAPLVEAAKLQEQRPLDPVNVLPVVPEGHGPEALKQVEKAQGQKGRGE